MAEIFYKDSYSILELNWTMNRAGEALQSVVDEFQKIGIKIKNPGEIAGLVNKDRIVIDDSLTKFCFNKLYMKTPAGIDRDKYFELVDMPSFSDLKNSFEGLNDYFGGLRLPDVIYWDAYNIEDGKVKINQAEKAKIESRYLEAAETTDEKERLKAVQDVCTALNSLGKLAEDEPSNYALKGVAVWNQDEKQFVPDRDFIKRGSVSFGILFGRESKPENIRSKPITGSVPDMKPDTPEADRAAAMAKARNQA